MSAPSPLRIGILGAARIAPMALIHPSRRVPGATVVAVAARDRTRAEAFARRHGIHTFILPALNAPDLEDIPEDLRRDMTFIPAKTLDDVLRAAF